MKSLFSNWNFPKWCFFFGVLILGIHLGLAKVIPMPLRFLVKVLNALGLQVPPWQPRGKIECLCILVCKPNMGWLMFVIVKLVKSNVCGSYLQTIIIQCQSRINEPGFINYGGTLHIVMMYDLILKNGTCPMFNSYKGFMNSRVDTIGYWDVYVISHSNTMVWRWSSFI